jgi:hypothetical protein
MYYVIIGCLLGNGYLIKHIKSPYFKLKYNKKMLNIYYILSINYKVLLIVYLFRKKEKNLNIITYSVHFLTRQLESLNEIYNL